MLHMIYCYENILICKNMFTFLKMLASNGYSVNILIGRLFHNAFLHKTFYFYLKCILKNAIFTWAKYSCTLFNLPHINNKSWKTDFISFNDLTGLLWICDRLSFIISHYYYHYTYRTCLLYTNAQKNTTEVSHFVVFHRDFFPLPGTKDNEYFKHFLLDYSLFISQLLRSNYIPPKKENSKESQRKDCLQTWKLKKYETT